MSLPSQSLDFVAMPAAPRRPLGARSIAFGLLALGACAVPMLASDFQIFQLTMVLVYAIALVGYNLLAGYNGQLSLGHGAFFAIGAYTVAIVLDRNWMPYWAALPLAAGVSFVAGFLFGFPALRRAGLYLAITTFALATATPQLLKFHLFERWTGGVQGVVVNRPEPPALLGLNGDQWMFYLCLAVAALMFLLAWNLVTSRTGRAIVAIRDNPIAAESMGVNLAFTKTVTFGVSAMFTGVAGGLSALVAQFVSPDSFTAFFSFSLLVGSVVGGVSSIWGALLGAVFIQFVPNVAGEMSKAAPWAIYGAFLIGCMYLLPGGIAGLVEKLAARRRRR